MNLTGTPYALMPMASEDVSTVAALEQEIFTLPWSANSFRYEVSHNAASEYIVLRYTPWHQTRTDSSLLKPVRRLLQSESADPSILGYAGTWLIVDEAHICTIGLRAEWRGRGLGELLLLHLIEKARQRRARIVTLEVRVSNSVAQNLYEKYGFERVGRRKRYYSDNREDAYIMTTPPINSVEYRLAFDTLRNQLRERLLAQPDEPPNEATAS
jgi:ribosomal-protein-alanine N-acetyltransferase